MAENMTTNSIYATRKKSGLVRSFGLFGAFLFGIHCISLSSSGFIPFSWVASVWPGASISGVLIIAALLCTIHGISYAIIGSITPSAGADYVLASRVVHPSIAFAASFTLVLFSGIVAGGLAAWIPQSAIPTLFKSMSIILHDSKYELFANFSSSSTGTLLIGSVIVVISIWAVSISNINLQRIMIVGFVLGIIAWIIVYFSLFLADGPEHFKNAWNNFMGSSSSFGLFDDRINLAKKAGMKLNTSVSEMTLAGLIMGFWIYYGYYIPTFFSEEIQTPSKTLIQASSSAIIFSMLIFVLGDLLLENLVSPEWIAAEGYIANNPGLISKVTGGESVPAMPWITFYAAILLPIPILIYTVAVAWIFTLINLIQTYFFYSSRIVLSWGLDRLMPDWITKLSPGTNTPRRAVFFFGAFAIFGLYDASEGGPLATQMTFVFFAVVTQMVPIFAFTFLPFLNSQLFEKAPDYAKKKYFGIPLLSIIGGVTFLYLLWMVYASFKFPAVGIKDPISTLKLLIAMLMIGIIWFFVIKIYRNRKDGIDIMKTFSKSVKMEESNFE
ncbi:MAG: APC family permease [Ignavibacteriales bacterium]|nr:APC family permease [Ignavibacteriales bacterium]